MFSQVSWFQSAVLKYHVACIISNLRAGLACYPNASKPFFSSSVPAVGKVGWLPPGGMMQGFGSDFILPLPALCTSLLHCCLLSQLEIQNGTSNIMFWYSFQHTIIPGQSYITCFCKCIKRLTKKDVLSSLSELCPSAAHPCIFLL